MWDFSAPREELAGRGLIFPVVRVEVRYRAPAVYDDLLSIESRILELGRTSVTFGQKVLRAGDDALLCEGEVTLVCVGPGMKARRMPDELRSLAPSPAFPREPA